MLEMHGVLAVVDHEQLRGRDLDTLKLELERQYVTLLFRDVRGDLAEMMRRLGVKRTQLYALFRRLNLEPRELRRGL